MLQLCRAEDKFNNLVAFLRQHKHEKLLVFFRSVTPGTRLSVVSTVFVTGRFDELRCDDSRVTTSTCACVEYYGRALETLVRKVAIHCIHGKMKHKRNSIFADFRKLRRSDGVCVQVR